MTQWILAAVACAAAITLPQAASAQGWHRMGGMPDMPAEMLKPPEGEPHHLRYHQAGGQPIRTFAFGEPGDDSKTSRTVELEARDDSGFSAKSLQVRAGETVRFIVRNLGLIKHELRIGDPDY